VYLCVGDAVVDVKRIGVLFWFWKLGFFFGLWWDYVGAELQ